MVLREFREYPIITSSLQAFVSNKYFSSLLSLPPDHTFLHHFPFSLLPNSQHKHNSVQKHSYNPSENLLLQFRRSAQGPTPMKLRSPIPFSGETQTLPLHLFTCPKLLSSALFCFFFFFFHVPPFLHCECLVKNNVSIQLLMYIFCFVLTLYVGCECLFTLEYPSCLLFMFMPLFLFLFFIFFLFYKFLYLAHLLKPCYYDQYLSIYNHIL